MPVTCEMEKPKAETASYIEDLSRVHGYYVSSPARAALRRRRMLAPSFTNLVILRDLRPNQCLADAVAILALIDFVMGEADWQAHLLASNRIALRAVD